MTPTCDGSVDGSSDVVGITDIALSKERLTLRFGYLLCNLISVFFVQVGDEDLASFAGKLEARRTTDTRASA